MARPGPTNGNGNGNGHMVNGHGAEAARGPGADSGRPPGVGISSAPPIDARSFVPGRRPEIEYVSPLRGGILPDEGAWERPGTPAATLPRIAPAEPVSTYGEVAGSPEASDRDVEPALPDEARSRVAAEAAAGTAPLEAPIAGSVLHVRFSSAPAAQVVEAFKVITQLVRERPGDTEVVVHVPAPGGRPQPMPLPRRVAYDSDLLAEVRRRLGEALVQLSVAPPA
jgi:hypothetical protein